MLADRDTYLRDEVLALSRVWPHNSTFNIVCHGHSIPCGYTASHMVSPFDAYPHLLHRILNCRFPTAVINVITSAIGGENSISGAKRFKQDVLSHHPGIVTVDYGGNDLFQEPDKIEAAWRRMAEETLEAAIKVIFITPALDCGKPYYPPENKRFSHEEHAAIIRRLAAEYGIALADLTAVFAHNLAQGGSRHDYLVSVNHLNRKGHILLADALNEWFPFILKNERS